MRKSRFASVVQHRSKSHLRRVIFDDTHLSDLSTRELETISKLPFFAQAQVESRKQYTTKKRQAYLNEKIPAVRLQFGGDPNCPEFISHTLPKQMHNPFKAVQSANRRDATRLSVTKLLTKSWCELRHAYDTYAQVPIFEGKHVIGGKEEHQKLEDETHSLAEEKRKFERDFEVDIPHDEFHTLAESWFQSLVKMVNLFTDGEAREVLCHGYLNSESCQLVEGSRLGDKDVLVSGIIDHLILNRKDCHANNRVLPVTLESSVVSKKCDDIALVLDQLRKAEPDLKNKYEIIVSDVKTRYMRKIPSQRSVLEASKLQVMYYRYFVKTLGRDPSTTYTKLLTNAKRRGFDVNRFVDPAKVLSMMATDDLIRLDMYRLKMGDPIGFEPFDNRDLEVSDSAVYDMSDYHDMITDATVIEKYSDFFEAWAEPVTLKYFAARLAQMYHRLAPLLSDRLMVEYYYDGDNFDNIMFDYDLETLKASCFSSAQFWFGKREIEPIKPNLRNFLTYCKSCDYESVCSWKKAGSDMCKQLGKDLAKLNRA